MAIDRSITGYMDGIDFEYHLGHDSKGIPVFASVENAKAGKRCLAKGGRCGIAKVEVRFVEWVEKPDISGEVDAKAALPPGAE